MEQSTEDWNTGRLLLLQRCKNRALTCVEEQEYSRAFAHFIIALTVQPSVKGELLNVFLFTLEKLVETLEKEKQINEIIMCYEQALEVLPHDSHVLHGLATTLFRFGFVECALSYFLKSYKANPFFTPSLYCMENLKNALVERWHFVMLNDKARNSAYQRAVRRAVEGGHRIVLDIGAGTGLLSMMAADANAESVHACESSEIMFSVLQNVVELNAKSITLHPKSSLDLQIGEDLPEKVSLVVTEIFDAGLLGENSLETLHHAWEHLLKKEGDECGSPSEIGGGDASPDRSSAEGAPKTVAGRVIPDSAEVFVVPVECEKFRKSFRLDDKAKQALHIEGDVIPQYSDEEPYSSDKIRNLPCDCTYLSAPVAMLRANFNSPKDIQVLLEGKTLSPSFTCTKSGSLDAFVMWFDLHLDDQETISTAPLDGSDGSCWEQAIFYVLPQYLEGSQSSCEVNDAIEAEFLCRGHLELKSVKLSNRSPKSDVSQTISMDPSLIESLNALAAQGVVGVSLRDVCPLDNASVLDISPFPFLGLKCLTDTASSVCVLRSAHQTEIERLRGVPSERLAFRTYEEFCNAKRQYDFLIVDPVEMCGLLRKNLIEDVTMLRMQCLKESGVVLPAELEIHAVLVESRTLSEHAKLVTDERVLDYKIARVMNAYKCQIHQDLHLSALPHRRLSDPFRLCRVDLNAEQRSTDAPRSAEVEATARGTLTAVAYWFRLRYRFDLVADTSEGLWRQAAFVLDEPAAVEEGQKLQLRYSLKSSCLKIDIVQP